MGLATFGGWLLARRAARRAAEQKRAEDARKRRAADVELREAVLELVRRTADSERWRLIQDYGHPADRGYLADREQRARRAAVLLDDIEAGRKRLWRALGMPDPEEPQAVMLTAAQKQALLSITQTKRLEAVELSPEARAAYLAELQQPGAIAPVEQERR